MFERHIRADSPVLQVPPESPCIGHCVLDAQQGWCGGCFRTLAEIGAWSRSSPAEKHAIVAACQARQSRQPPPAPNP